MPLAVRQTWMSSVFVHSSSCQSNIKRKCELPSSSSSSSSSNSSSSSSSGSGGGGNLEVSGTCPSLTCLSTAAVHRISAKNRQEHHPALSAKLAMLEMSLTAANRETSGRTFENTSFIDSIQIIQSQHKKTFTHLGTRLKNTEPHVQSLRPTITQGRENKAHNRACSSLGSLHGSQTIATNTHRNNVKKNDQKASTSPERALATLHRFTIKAYTADMELTNRWEKQHKEITKQA